MALPSAVCTYPCPVCSAVSNHALSSIPAATGSSAELQVVDIPEVVGSLPVDSCTAVSASTQSVVTASRDDGTTITVCQQHQSAVINSTGNPMSASGLFSGAVIQCCTVNINPVIQGSVKVPK